MFIDCIGCLHGARPKLEGGDILIISGDLLPNDTLAQINLFKDWLKEEAIKYTKTIMIAGNHDNWIHRKEFFNRDPASWEHESLCYLEDSGTEFEYEKYEDHPNSMEGIVNFRKTFKIWGSPWTSRFEGINPHCCAFTGADDDEIAPHFELIPPDVDILITHGPPFAIRDMTKDGKQVGSVSLMAQHICRLRPKLWVFSHIHEGYGKDGPYEWSGTTYVNCSIMNEKYEPINKPIRIEL